MEILAREELCDHIFPLRVHDLMAKYSDDLVRSDLCKSYICFIILFIPYTYIDVSLDNISDFLSLSESSECFEDFFLLLCFLEVESASILSHLSFDACKYVGHIALQKASRVRYMTLMFTSLIILEEAWCWTESYIVVHTWYRFSCFISDIYLLSSSGELHPTVPDTKYPPKSPHTLLYT